MRMSERLDSERTCLPGTASTVSGRCEATKPTTIERRWELREKVYEVGLGVGIAVFFGAFAARLRSRPVRATVRATFLAIPEPFTRWSAALVNSWPKRRKTG